jgi:hypothetical protein
MANSQGMTNVAPFRKAPTFGYRRKRSDLKPGVILEMFGVNNACRSRTKTGHFWREAG